MLQSLYKIVLMVSPFPFQLKEYSQKAVEILRAQNHILTNHPNSNIYKYVFTNMLYCHKGNAISSSGHRIDKNIIICCFSPAALCLV